MHPIDDTQPNNQKKEDKLENPIPKCRAVNILASKSNNSQQFLYTVATHLSFFYYLCTKRYTFRYNIVYVPIFHSGLKNQNFYIDECNSVCNIITYKMNIRAATQ